MIHVLLEGRLGNNLFQIAAGYSLAKQHNTEVKFYAGDHITSDKESLYDYLQQFNTTILRDVIINAGKPMNSLIVIKEKQFAYEPIPYVEDSLIEGFYQSEKFFESHKTEIRNLFEIDNNTKRVLEEKYGHILQGEITSINVRRGDYLTELCNHPIIAMRYFKKAINLIGHEKRFLIVSDDIDWCKTQFKGSNFFFVEKQSAILDIYIQTLCTNNIISNSTFGWWGAWLNKNPDKIVICPTPWFGVAKQHCDTSDLIPTGWIKLKNKMLLRHTLIGYYIWYKRRLNYFVDCKIKRV